MPKNENDCINANSLFPEYLASVLSKTPDNNPWVIQLSSTATVYGDQGKVWVDEQSHSLEAQFTQIKDKGEISLINGAKNSKYRLTILRISNTFGKPRNIQQECWHLALNEFCRMVFKKGNIEIFGEPEKQIDFIPMNSFSSSIKNYSQ